jgi:hypothetical protein
MNDEYELNSKIKNKELYDNHNYWNEKHGDNPKSEVHPIKNLLLDINCYFICLHSWRYELNDHEFETKYFPDRTGDLDVKIIQKNLSISLENLKNFNYNENLNNDKLNNENFNNDKLKDE